MENQGKFSSSDNRILTKQIYCTFQTLKDNLYMPSPPWSLTSKNKVTFQSVFAVFPSLYCINVRLVSVALTQEGSKVTAEQQRARF